MSDTMICVCKFWNDHPYDDDDDDDDDDDGHQCAENEVDELCGSHWSFVLPILSREWRWWPASTTHERIDSHDPHILIGPKRSFMLNIFVL